MASFLAIAFSLAVLVFRVEGGVVPAIYVFGDSLADVGNNNYLSGTNAKANFPHNGVDYPGGVPTGRFSNGYNAIDFLAQMLGFRESPPPFLSLKNDAQMLNGVNFASGGSGILDSTGNTISFTAQVVNFNQVADVVTKRMEKSTAPLLLSKSLFLISSGSNDLFAYYSNFGPQNSTQNDQFIASLILKFEEHLTALYKLGARKFGIFGASHIGCIPSVRIANPSGQCVEDLNHLAQLFNRAAKAQLHHLSKTMKGMKYAYANAYETLSLVLAKPDNYGYKDIINACCGSGRFNGASACTPNATLCSNRKNHLFWDWVHPTEVTYRFQAISAFKGSRKFATPTNIRKLVHY